MYILSSDDMIKKISEIKDLPTLPVITFEVNKMLANDRITVDRLSQTIEKDQVIVSKLLKLVNSSFFGVRSRVSSVQEAVVRLGFNSVRNVVLSVSVFESLTIDDAGMDFNIQDFWTHSVAVAITSRYLSEKARMQDPDDCFVGGLLHDIGLIIMARYFPDILSAIMHKVMEKRISIYQAEHETIPLRHNKIAEIMAKRWQLPPALCDTLKYHHTPNKYAVNPELLTLIHLGDIIVRRNFPSSFNPVREKVDPVLSSVAPSLEKKLDHLFQTSVNWFPDVMDVIRDACEFFIHTKEHDHHE